MLIYEPIHSRKPQRDKGSSDSWLDYTANTTYSHLYKVTVIADSVNITYSHLYKVTVLAEIQLTPYLHSDHQNIK